MEVHVGAGGDLQAALDAAQLDDVIVLEEAATFTGNFRVTKGLTITTAGELPDGKLGAEDVAALPTLRTPNSTPALCVVAPAEGVLLTGLHFAAGTSSGDVVQLGDASTDNLPTDIVLDRCAITVDTQAKRGVQLNSRDTQILGCRITGVRMAGQETQAICGWNGPGPFLIEDCYIEAGSIGVLFGGAGAVRAEMSPANITFRRNVVTRPLSMRGAGYGVKNLFELKNAQHVEVTGNDFSNNWPDGQAGYAIVFTVRANSANAPWSTVRHVRFESNIVRCIGAGINILGVDNQGGYASQPMEDVVIRNNLFYDIDRHDWSSGKPGEVAGGVFMQIGELPRDLLIENNTAMGAGSITGNIIAFWGQPCADFVFRRNLVQKLMTPYQTYGVNGDKVGEGNPALATYAPGCEFHENVLAGCTPSQYSNYPGNHFPTVDELAGMFVDPANGNFRLVDSSPFTGLGVDMDALDAAFQPPVEPPEGSTDEVIRRLADDALEAACEIGGDVSPQAAAQRAIEDYRDALLEAL